MLNDVGGIIVTNLGGQCKSISSISSMNSVQRRQLNAEVRSKMVDRYGCGDVFSKIQDFVLTYLKS